LSKDFNLAFGKLAVPAAKIGMIVVFMFAFMAVVRLRKEMDWLSLAMVTGFSAIVPALVIPMTVMMSKLYDISSQFKANMTPTVAGISDFKSKQDLSGELKSCSPIRRQVGNLYCMEAKAKLTLLDQVVHGVIFLFVNV